MAESPQERKVLVLASTFPRWKDDREPRFIEDLCGEVARTHSVTVLAPHCRGAKFFEKSKIGNQSIDVYRFQYFIPAFENLAYDGGILANIRGNPLKALLVPFFLLGQLYKIASLQRKNNFDVIHAHWIIPQGLVAALFVSMWPNAPRLLITAHGGDLFALRGQIFTMIKRWILRKSTQVSVVSKVMKATCEELGVAADKIRIRSMGVDLVSVFTIDGRSTDRSNLIFVGRLVEKKGVPHLLHAMKLLAKSHPHLELTVVGDGPDRDKLEILTRKLRIERNVSFVGGRLNTDLPDLLRSAKIAVMPSIVAKSGDQEGLGLVAIEAMGCGCAVVATDLPAIRDSVRHGETGLIAIAGDEIDLANNIDMLLRDEALAETLAESGRQFALRNFDWSVVGREYSKILSDI